MKQLRPVVPKRRRLPLPVSRVLADPLDERAINKMWRTIERRRGQPVHPIGKWILVLACIGSLGVLASVLMPRNQPQPLAAANNVGAKANSSAQASLLSPIEVPPMAPPVDVTMADGSHILVAGGGRVETLATTDSTSLLRLVRGRATFDVVRRTSRRFVVEAGLASVEVVGTRFEVDRMENSVRVFVTRGVVLVHSNRLEDGVRRLEAGQSVELSGDPSHTRSAPVTSASGTPRAAPASKDWLELEKERDHERAYALLNQRGLEQELSRARSSEALFAMADAARLSGHPEQAMQPLRRLLSDYPRSHHAPLAALTLGRLELSLGQPARAADTLARALRLGVPSGLREDVYVRRIEALVRSGQLAEARHFALEYDQQFPAGRNQIEIERWLSSVPNESPIDSPELRLSPQ